jgi:hypothetical protein
MTYSAISAEIIWDVSPQSIRFAEKGKKQTGKYNGSNT